MKTRKDKTGLVQLCHQHCAPLCDNIVGRDRNCAGKSTQAVGQKDTGHDNRYWDLEAEAYTDPGPQGSRASGWFLRELNE